MSPETRDGEKRGKVVLPHSRGPAKRGDPERVSPNGPARPTTQQLSVRLREAPCSPSPSVVIGDIRGTLSGAVQGRLRRFRLGRLLLKRIAAAACLLLVMCCQAGAAGHATRPAMRIGDAWYWQMMRLGPFPYPNDIRPEIPETLAGGPPVVFEDYFGNLTLVLPDRTEEVASDRDSHALDKMVYSIWTRARRCRIVSADKFDESANGHHLAVLGTLDTNSFAREFLGKVEPGFMKGLKLGAYRVQALPLPQAPKRRAIFALGTDPEGAWRAAIFFYLSLHRQKTRLGALAGWSQELPAGSYWAPVEARFTGDPGVAPPTPAPRSAPPRPRVPYGIRTWNSPTPTLESYDRMVRALKPSGINCIVVQPGGWQDVADSGAVCRAALDIAWSHGLHTVFYIGNDLVGHRPSPLQTNHKAIAAAIRHHPGLLSWRVYNQLADALTPVEQFLVRSQIAWLREISALPIGVEVVWGHASGAPPERKAWLLKKLSQWGCDELETDCAPVGGWSYTKRIDVWEEKIAALSQYSKAPMALLQGHIVFRDPVVVTPAQMRNQYWWALAGGAKGFFWEAACVVNHFSNRGFLTWALRPTGDGRLAEVGRLAAVTRRLEDVILGSTPAPDHEAPLPGFELVEGREKIAVRPRASGEDAHVYLMLINRDTEKQIRAVWRCDRSLGVAELAHGGNAHPLPAGQAEALTLAPGGGACYRIQLAQ